MLLPSSRYEEIKGEVADLFAQCGVKTLPVDPYKIAGVLGIAVVPHSSLGPSRDAALSYSEDGFKFMLDCSGSTRHLIYINDAKGSGRQRFTMLHEIGHLVLGHQQGSDVAKAEADFFAKYAIALLPVIDMVDPSDYTNVATAFGTSVECALNCWSYYQKWCRISPVGIYEETIKTLFGEAVREGGDAMTRMKKGA